MEPTPIVPGEAESGCILQVPIWVRLGAQIVQFGMDAQPVRPRRVSGGERALRYGRPRIFQALGSDCPDGGGARREMVAAASSLLGAPSLRRMCETWTLTVLTLMTSAAAISRLV